MKFQHTAARRRLRTKTPGLYSRNRCFNTQPPEGGCGQKPPDYIAAIAVSTHSRPKAAASNVLAVANTQLKFQHTAARRRLPRIRGHLSPAIAGVSTHSRPKAAAAGRMTMHQPARGFQHTAARRRLPGALGILDLAFSLFQHTAARRRLQAEFGTNNLDSPVSTHSRPKAAAPYNRPPNRPYDVVSTHSRPKAAARNSGCQSPF